MNHDELMTGFVKEPYVQFLNTYMREKLHSRRIRRFALEVESRKAFTDAWKIGMFLKVDCVYHPLPVDAVVVQVCHTECYGVTDLSVWSASYEPRHCWWQYEIQKNDWVRVAEDQLADQPSNLPLPMQAEANDRLMSYGLYMSSNWKTEDTSGVFKSLQAMIRDNVTVFPLMTASDGVTFTRYELPGSDQAPAEAPTPEPTATTPTDPEAGLTWRQRKPLL